MSFTSISSVLADFLSSDNDIRGTAEKFIDSIPEADFLGGLQTYVGALDIVDSSVNQWVAVWTSV